MAARSFWMGIGCSALMLMYSTPSAHAHEFWLMPEQFTVEAGQLMRVDLRNGEMMKGASLPYLPGDVTRFDVVTAGSAIPVVSRIGDQPALAMPAPAEGLAVVVLETKDRTVTYDDFAKFTRFVTHKAAPDVQVQHSARGLPQTGFTERYRRYTKSLIAVGSGAGADRAMGLRIEIVALANPYTDDVSAGLPLKVLLDGQPHAGAQIELFAQTTGGVVTVSMHVTDANGVAVVPAQRGKFYLADTVDIFALPNNSVIAGSVWHSDWASMTYLVP